MSRLLSCTIVSIPYQLNMLGGYLMQKEEQTLPIELVQQTLNAITLNNIAKQCGFMKRKPKKIYPLNILYGLFILVLGSGNSLSNLALKIGILNNCTISKQAIFKRMNDNLISFLESVLMFVLIRTTNMKSKPCFQNQLFSKFRRALVQDSTSIKLDARFAQDFPGSKNQTGKKSATAKIQAVMDILTEQFCYFNITPFTRNDQSASADILKIAQPFDLIIRDLGYFVCAVFKKCQMNKIFFFEQV